MNFSLIIISSNVLQDSLTNRKLEAQTLQSRIYLYKTLIRTTQKLTTRKH